MNYRHAFHAGNHTEVFKHAALILVLEHLLVKPQPFVVLDTHAGIGLYDLTSEPARKTGEYEQGVARVAGHELASAPAYTRLIGEMNPGGLTAYPGSPEIVRRFLAKTVYDWLTEGIAPARAASRGIASFPEVVDVGLLVVGKRGQCATSNRDMASALLVG